jgi:hypothetical protein
MPSGSSRRASGASCGVEKWVPSALFERVASSVMMLSVVANARGQVRVFFVGFFDDV